MNFGMFELTDREGEVVVNISQINTEDINKVGEVMQTVK
jgi:repressor of nif and glnA expression